MQGSETFPVKANPPGSSVGFFNNENPLGYPGSTKMQTADCRVGTKCRLGTKCRMQTAD